ncbi:uncharacterized protein LOC121504974 [Cheilinus undulatus]|uniref:uncharacterized protein LOC121504974 n=1 Tax=Cheilinus undulatus TaxID=241271 RepID=UPI001BD249DE|nr:uncharacterized protein LOC121504974 [Cheilinus undulatus]
MLRASNFYATWEEKLGEYSLLRDSAYIGQAFPFVITPKRDNGALSEADQLQNSNIYWGGGGEDCVAVAVGFSVAGRLVPVAADAVTLLQCPSASSLRNSRPLRSPNNRENNIVLASQKFCFSLQKYGQLRASVICSVMNLVSVRAVLLCSLSWLSVSASEAQTVEVQSNEDATLMCSNMTIKRNATFWFRLVEGKDIQCVSFKTSPDSEAKLCGGNKVPRYKMWSNASSMSLSISSVKGHDSGMYFCGFYSEGHPVFRLKHLKIRGQDSDEAKKSMDSEPTKECDETPKLVSLILSGLTVFLVMVIVGLVVQHRKLQTAAAEEQNQRVNGNTASEELNYAAVTFQARRREPEPNVIYATTR